MTTVFVSPAARTDLLEIDGHIWVESPQAADRFGARLEAIINDLVRFPEKHAERPAMRNTRAIVRPYLIFYRYSSELDQVVVQRVLHGARDLTALLDT